MITDADIKKLKKVFVSKNDLKKEVSRLDKRIDGLKIYIDYRLEPFEEMRKDFYSFKDQVLKTLDWLVGAFKKFDEEHTILSGQYSEVQIKIENHETRIGIIEKKNPAN